MTELILPFSLDKEEQKRTGHYGMVAGICLPENAPEEAKKLYEDEDNASR